MIRLTKNMTLDQDPKVLFDIHNNKYFFEKEELIEHQKYLNKNDKFREVAEPLTGDLVQLPDGSQYQLICLLHSDSFQLTSVPGYNYVDRGFRSYSGSFAFDTEHYWTTLHNLTPTGQIKRVRVWSFSGGIAAAHKGISWIMNVPVWKLKQRRYLR